MDIAYSKTQNRQKLRIKVNVGLPNLETVGDCCLWKKIRDNAAYGECLISLKAVHTFYMKLVAYPNVNFTKLRYLFPTTAANIRYLFPTLKGNQVFIILNYYLSMARYSMLQVGKKFSIEIRLVLIFIPPINFNVKIKILNVVCSYMYNSNRRSCLVAKPWNLIQLRMMRRRLVKSSTNRAMTEHCASYWIVPTNILNPKQLVDVLITAPPRWMAKCPSDKIIDDNLLKLLVNDLLKLKQFFKKSSLPYTETACIAFRQIVEFAIIFRQENPSFYEEKVFCRFWLAVNCYSAETGSLSSTGRHHTPQYIARGRREN